MAILVLVLPGYLITPRTVAVVARRAGSALFPISKIFIFTRHKVVRRYMNSYNSSSTIN